MADEAPARRDLAVRSAGFAALACFVGALLGFGAALEGYRHDAWPVALLGAAGVPRAAAFNLCAYLLPGLLAAFVALHARATVQPSSAAARIGWTLALLAALAFAAQCFFPLDATRPDAGRGRLHGVAWALWGIAFAAAAVTLALSSLRQARWSAAAVHLCAGLVVFGLGWLSEGSLATPLSQRLAFGGWFAWLAWAAWARPASPR